VARDEHGECFLGIAADIFPQQCHVIGHHLTYTIYAAAKKCQFILPFKNASACFDEADHLGEARQYRQLVQGQPDEPIAIGPSILNPMPISSVFPQPDTLLCYQPMIENVTNGCSCINIGYVPNNHT
jgi:hypothetical protein